MDLLVWLCRPGTQGRPPSPVLDTLVVVLTSLGDEGLLGALAVYPELGADLVGATVAALSVPARRAFVRRRVLDGHPDGIRLLKDFRAWDRAFVMELITSRPALVPQLWTELGAGTFDDDSLALLRSRPSPGGSRADAVSVEALGETFRRIPKMQDGRLLQALGDLVLSGEPRPEQLRVVLDVMEKTLTADGAADAVRLLVPHAWSHAIVAVRRYFRDVVQGNTDLGRFLLMGDDARALRLSFDEHAERPSLA